MKGYLILILTNIATICVFVVVVSVMNNAARQKDSELNHLKTQNSDFVESFEQMRKEVDETNAKLNASLTQYAEGVNNAKADYTERSQAIEQLKEDERAKDWLCEPLPFDICELFDGAQL